MQILIKKIVIFISIIFILILCPNNPSSAQFKNANINYDLLYNDMPILDFMYEDGVDLEEQEDYNEYIISPYTLVRVTEKLINKKNTLNPGYYLVKPNKKDGYNFLLFKQNGKIAAIVPVYQKIADDTIITSTAPPKPKPSLPMRIMLLPKNAFIDAPLWVLKFSYNNIWPFTKLPRYKKVPLPPEARLEYKTADEGKYIELWLSVEGYVHKALFKTERI